MKRIAIFALIIVTSLQISAAVIKIKVSNPNPKNIIAAPVVIKLQNYPKIHPTLRSNLAVYQNGKQISSQLDDLNGDLIPDELVFLLDIKAGETKKISLKTISDKKRKSFPTEVYTDLIVIEKDGSHSFVKEVSSTKNDMYNALHHHGVAFESALMAYRIYFDNKSTIDIYGKKKQQLEIEKSGWYPSNEQLKAGFGDDILLVSDWVGVGTVKGWNGKKATHIDKFDKRTQRIVSSGNLRAIVETEVKGWEYEGKKTDLKVRYIIYARHRDAICEVSASNDIKTLATGVQKIGKGDLLKSNRLTGSWGTHFPQPDTLKYARETVGLGVYVPEKYEAKNTVAGADNLVLMPYKKGETLQFHITAAWAKEEQNPFKNSTDFFAYLKEWSENLNELIIK